LKNENNERRTGESVTNCLKKKRKEIERSRERNMSYGQNVPYFPAQLKINIALGD
jgi:hypothetical protein